MRAGDTRDAAVDRPKEPSPEGRSSVTAARVQLALGTAAALTVFFVVDRGIHRVAISSVPWLAHLADLRVTSLSLIVAAFLWSRYRLPILPARVPPRAFKVAIYWLVGVTVSVHLFHFGVVPLPRWIDKVAFLGTGLIGEELLCRGIVLGAALHLWPSERSRAPILWSAVAFALMHLQYHDYQLTTDALMQLLWTFPMGVVLALLAVRSRSLALPWAVHLLTNGLAALNEYVY